jgi:hypothetical protein
MLYNRSLLCPAGDLSEKSGSAWSAEASLRPTNALTLKGGHQKLYLVSNRRCSPFKMGTKSMSVQQKPPSILLLKPKKFRSVTPPTKNSV